MLLFILVVQGIKRCRVKISIHLMLLFIMPDNSLHHIMYDFNTSHVTVYLIGCVSTPIGRKFQYISCYCLSQESNKGCRNVRISIHLMLLFIECNKARCKSSNIISIHLMLLFILDWIG